jgi:hypothetical protein
MPPNLTFFPGHEESNRFPTLGRFGRRPNLLLEVGDMGIFVYPLVVVGGGLGKVPLE